MIFRSLIIGFASTALLVALLVLSRIFGAPSVPKVTLTELETVVIEPPAPPPELSEPEEPEDLPPPPAPKLELYANPDAIDSPEIALSLSRIDLKTPIEPFHTDMAPATVPVIRKAQPTRTPAKRTTTPTKPTRPTPNRPPVKKAFYSTNELDGKPSIIRKGQFRWPSRAKGVTGKVTLLLEISESGRVSVISVVSTTDPALNPSAMRVARGSRFTSPRKNGQKVKARFLMPFSLKKP